MNVEKEGVIYFLEKKKGETNNVYFDRVNLIVKDNPKNQSELDNNKKKIMFEINSKYLGCKY